MTEKLLKLVGIDLVKPETAITGPSGGPCLDFIASTGCLDRYMEVIEPSGWRLDSYKLNPVFQNSHQYDDIVFTLGRAVVTEVREIDNGRKGLFQRIEFATEANPIAKVAFRLYAGGFLKAVSVGFLPVRWEEGSEKTQFRRRYLEQELLEVSAVAVPANPEALLLGLKSGALTRTDLNNALDILTAALGRATTPWASRSAGAGTPLHARVGATTPLGAGVWDFARQLRSIIVPPTQTTHQTKS